MKDPFTQDAWAHLRVNHLMLLASWVNTPIDHNVFHNLRTRVARCSASCVNWASICPLNPEDFHMVFLFRIKQDVPVPEPQTHTKNIICPPWDCWMCNPVFGTLSGRSYEGHVGNWTLLYCLIANYSPEEWLAWNTGVPQLVNGLCSHCLTHVIFMFLLWLIKNHFQKIGSIWA